jgi:uncharacterized phiE125 gp8 family phage protein
VTYGAGSVPDEYSDEEWDAPEDIKQAVVLLVGHWFENREAVVAGSSQEQMPLAVDALLDSHIRVVV